MPPSVRRAAPPSGAAIASIFEPTDTHGRPRGQDIRVSIEVPSHALGDAAGYFVALPLHVEHEGALVERNLVKAEDERGVRLFLPETLQSPTTLRLRGQGGRCDDGVAGDLFVQISVVPSRALVPIASRPLVVGAGATLLLALAAALAVLL